MRRILLALVTAVTAAVTLAAQQPQAQQQPPPSAQTPANPQQPPVFRAGTNQVRVDVTVLDRKGDPVTDLTKDDFDVREDGLPQAIDTIKLIEANGDAPADDTSLPIRSPEHAAVEAARDDIRVFVIFWDEYHVGQMAPAIRAREALTNFVQFAFGPTDLVALMDQLTPTDAIRFTRDRRALADQVHKLQGRQGVYVPARSAVEEAQMYRSRDIEMLRAQVTASALESTIAFLGSIKEGRKSILFVSQTIGRLGTGPMDNFTWLDAATRAANANNVSIYSFDPRGLDMNIRPSEILQSLAENTGGKQFSNNEPSAALRQIVKNARAFYLLGYASAKNPADGKFHKIAVKVKRPGVEVRARTGYFAPSTTDMNTAREKAAKDEAPPDISKALATIVDAPHMAAPGDLWAGAAPGPDGTPRVTLAWTQRDDSRGAVAISVKASAGDGTVYFDGPVPGNRAAFAAPPGTLRITRRLLDADGSPGDRAESTIEVPDFARAPLAITSPVVFRGRTPIELRAIQADPDPQPFAGRQFERTDRIVVRFALVGPAAADATVTANLLSRRGASLATLPLKAVPGRGFELDLPIGSIARGEYVIAIAASRGADQARTLVSFRVGSPQ
ncbi:MAG TPA: VWA domain-containing protein [Vicinamibacterales bacterium]|nr:VWA domain-containing protein [Vicinamibacterales bacterium]